jgi:hypothetical protein
MKTLLLTTAAALAAARAADNLTEPVVAQQTQLDG